MKPSLAQAGPPRLQAPLLRLSDPGSSGSFPCQTQRGGHLLLAQPWGRVWATLSLQSFQLRERGLSCLEVAVVLELPWGQVWGVTCLDSAAHTHLLG